MLKEFKPKSNTNFIPNIKPKTKPKYILEQEAD